MKIGKVFITRAREGWGKGYILRYRPPLQKNLLPKNLRLCIFVNLTLKNAERSELPKTIGFLWRTPKKKFLKLTLL
ncbi:MAG: hypothetical protein A3F51_02685 [Candidatus Taylorbacteria bacterium RIFCSPHIGHO2_12_FULL_45_16]|uniref:Uncharacterized protein n=1 Tax=Candidatus Taylorbacteria bacterium RIFCSPHIGHO2_12_FULL_45_16 TaxID=1802315 RepID=A0A1G2N094_9BACT|nr:MAG: hypothetical protein A3F51_02685 [Candidatus Taylorbacteria bacterium RIFCSPHIGHO2_12_FULL_45_16]